MRNGFSIYKFNLHFLKFYSNYMFNKQLIKFLKNLFSYILFLFFIYFLGRFYFELLIIRLYCITCFTIKVCFWVYFSHPFSIIEYKIIKSNNIWYNLFVFIII